MVAISKAVAVLNIVACPATPVAHFTVILAPSIYGAVVNSDLSLSSSLTLEVGSLVHVAVNAAMDTSDGISGGQSFRATVHGKSLGLKRLFEGSNAMSNLDGFGMVGVEILDLAL